jgi:hypothetical protein
MNEPSGVPSATRTARCARHGRVYDSRSEGGCPACAAEAEAIFAAQPGRRAGLLLLALGLLLAGGFALTLQPDPLDALLSMAQREGSAPAPQARRETAFAAPAGGSIDPAPYRAEIEAIEEVLYRGAPPGLGDVDRVSALAMQLGDRVHADLGPLAGRRALVRLVGFAAEAGAAGEAGYAAPELSLARAEWEALRRELFQPAPWLRTTTARLVAAQTPPVARATPRELGALRDWAAALEELVGSGRKELLRFGEQSVDVAEGSREERALVDRWRSFAREWDARVQQASAQAPPSPLLDGEPHVLQAHQELGQAARQLALATQAVGDYAVPMKWWREQCLDGAAQHLAEARRRLEAARRAAASNAG